MHSGSFTWGCHQSYGMLLRWKPKLITEREAVFKGCRCPRPVKTRLRASKEEDPSPDEDPSRIGPPPTPPKKPTNGRPGGRQSTGKALKWRKPPPSKTKGEADTPIGKLSGPPKQARKSKPVVSMTTPIILESGRRGSSDAAPKSDQEASNVMDAQLESKPGGPDMASETKQDRSLSGRNSQQRGPDSSSQERSTVSSSTSSTADAVVKNEAGEASDKVDTPEATSSDQGGNAIPGDSNRKSRSKKTKNKNEPEEKKDPWSMGDEMGSMFPEGYRELENEQDWRSGFDKDMDITKLPDEVSHQIFRDIWESCTIPNPFLPSEDPPDRDPDLSNPAEVEQGMREAMRNPKETQFDIKEIFGTSNIKEVFENLGDHDEEEDKIEGRNDDNDDEDDDIESEFSKPLDLSFSDGEARQFVQNMENVDLDQLIKGRKDLLGPFDDNASKYNLEKYKEEGWKDPVLGLAYEIACLLYPRVGKKTNRQNWSHINAPPKVLAKRAAKRVKRLAIWLSMEISRACTEAMEEIKACPKGSNEAKVAMEKCMQRISGFLGAHPRRVSMWHVGALFQRVALLATTAGLQDWVVREYKTILLTLLALLRSGVSDMEARSISEVVWGFGKLGPKLFRMKGDHMDLKNIEDKSPVDVQQVYSDLMKRAVGIKYGFNPKDVASFAYGVALLPKSVRDATAAGDLVDVCILHVENFGGQDIAQLLWSMVQLKMKSKTRVVKLMVEQADLRVTELKPQEVSMLIGSLAQLDYSCETLLDKLLEQIEFNGGFADFKHNEIANLSWGLTKLRYLPPPWFVQSMVDAAMAKLEDFTVGSTCIFLRSLSIWMFDAPSFIAACRVKLMSSLKMMKIQDVVNSAWSFSILGVLNEEYMRVCGMRLQEIGITKMKDSELRQFYQCIIDLSVFHPDSNMLDVIPEDLLDISKDAWVEEQAKNKVHPAVKEALQLLETTGVKSTERKWLKDVPCCTSVVEFASNVSHVIEVTMPKAKFQNAPNDLLGKFQWREKLLTCLGYFRLAIEPHVWKDLGSDEEKLKYLKAML